jgi:outer membrane receptor for monomeric catechols
MEDSGVSEAKKGTPSSEQGEIDVDIFFGHEGVVHDKYATDSETVNKENYVEILRRLRDAVRRGSKVTGTCPTSMFPPSRPTLSRTSWLNFRSNKCRSPYIHWTWSRVIFSYSQS